jgi:hypothetical protein
VGALLLNSGPRSWGEEEENTHQTFSLPPDPLFFQPGAGQEIANTYCLICHSADYVYTQPLLSQEKWQSLIVKMKHAFGCPIPDDQISFLAAYLFGQNSATLTSSENYP